jgi:hypothetical protein
MKEEEKKKAFFVLLLFSMTIINLYGRKQAEKAF